MNIVIESAELLEELKIDCTAISKFLRFAVRTNAKADNQAAWFTCNNGEKQIRHIEKNVINSRVFFREFPIEGVEEVIIRLGDKEGDLRINFILEESIFECMLRSMRIQYVDGNLLSFFEFHSDRVLWRDINLISFDKKGERNLHIERITGQQFAIPKIPMKSIDKFIFEIKKDEQEKNKANSVYSIGLWPERKTDIKTNEKWRKRE